MTRSAVMSQNYACPRPGAPGGRGGRGGSHSPALSKTYDEGPPPLMRRQLRGSPSTSITLFHLEAAICSIFYFPFGKTSVATRLLLCIIVGQKKTRETHVINGGGVSGWRIPLICLEDIVGGALAVVAPPLCAFGRVVGPFPRAGRVGGVVFRAGPLVHAGQSHVTQQGRLWEIEM